MSDERLVVRAAALMPAAVVVAAVTLRVQEAVRLDRAG